MSSSPTSKDTEVGTHNKAPKAHSIKVPRLYKVAANLHKRHRQEGESVKNLAFSPETRKRHPNVKAVYALLAESVRRDVCSLLDRAGVHAAEPGLDRDLGAVLTCELLFGKGTLPGQSRPVKTVLKYENQLRRAAGDQPNAAGKEDRLADRFPRYARVNAIKATTEEVVDELTQEGFEEARAPVSAAAFGQAASGLSEVQFMRDPLVPGLLAFRPGTNFYGHALAASGRLMLQDRASCFPVLALAPPAGSTVLDACAAPGMKTSQLAAAVGSEGKVYAVEKCPKRCKVLRKILRESGADAVCTVLNVDFTSVDPAEYPDVEYVVLDPSCSGSGMVRDRGVADKRTTTGPERLFRLSRLQTRLLEHAMSFPNVKALVYSTCSVAEEENELVVQKFAEADSGESRFEVERCLPGWRHRRGAAGYAFSEDVVRCDPESDLCNGFFVARFVAKAEAKAERKKAEQQEGAKKNKKKKRRKISAE